MINKVTELVTEAAIAILSDYGEDGDSWKLLGHCRSSTTPDQWFSNNRGQQAAAKQICSGCPVRDLCLSYAFQHGDVWGIWGGMNQGDRRKALATVISTTSDVAS
jgi:hypothetical protein